VRFAIEAKNTKGGNQTFAVGPLHTNQVSCYSEKWTIVLSEAGETTRKKK